MIVADIIVRVKLGGGIKLVLAGDQFLPVGTERALVTENSQFWLNALELDKEYRLTIEAK